MIPHTIIVRSKLVALFAAFAVTTLACAAGVAQAATAPVKEVEASHFGWEVDKTTKGTVCTVISGNECQPGVPSSEPGGFEYPESVAAAPDGDIYITDSGNHRIEELEADGKFVLMFGKDVNKKGGDLCTVAEASECQAGAEGVEPGQFTGPTSIAVDATTGDVYVAEIVEADVGGEEFRGKRVQELSATGQFVLEIGREVNETTKGNLCTEAEVAKCKRPALYAIGVPAPVERGSFNFVGGYGNLLVMSGNTLYVGDEHRVQEFDAETGVWTGEIVLTAISEARGMAVERLAVAPATGDIYLVYGSPSGAGDQELIREFSPAGMELKSYQVGKSVEALAFDPAGRLAVSEQVPGGEERGSLYEVNEASASLHPITRFASHGAKDMVFSVGDDLYAVFGAPRGSEPTRDEVIAYEPKPVAELLVGKTECVPGPLAAEADVTLECSLKGEVDPWGVPETDVWFEWGRGEALGEMTEPRIPLVDEKAEGEEETPLDQVSAPIVGVRPNEKVYDRLAGEDLNVKAPEEALTSGSIEELTTPPAPPRVVGQPLASFATPTSVVMVANLNPENTPTEYEFRYAPEADCDSSELEAGETLEAACTGVLAAPTRESPEYGEIGVAQEATGLQPATRYRYRLYAQSAGGDALGEAGGARVPEGSFETAAAPFVTAVSEGASAITATSALIAGTVNPDGQASVYTFEVGVYDGPATQYDTIFSASTGAGASPVYEQLPVTGLQPGTEYAYRITIHFGDGNTPGSVAIGEQSTFTTLGLPAVLVSPTPLPQLAIPTIKFPGTPNTKPAKKKKSKKAKAGKTSKTKAKKQSKPNKAKARKSDAGGR